MITQLKNILNSKLICVDYETEGLNLCYTRPWELAMDVYDKGKKLESKHAYIKWPNLNVSRGAAAATGFDPNKVEILGKDPKLICDKFFTYLYDESYTIIGHNILGYDAYIVNVCRRELGYPEDYSFIRRMIDTHALSKAYKLKLRPDESEDFTAWQYRVMDLKAKGVKTNLAAMCQEFGIEFDKTKLHAAGYDISRNYEVFKELVKRLN